MKFVFVILKVLLKDRTQMDYINLFQMLKNIHDYKWIIPSFQGKIFTFNFKGCVIAHIKVLCT